MNAPLVKRLVLKDLYIHRWPSTVPGRLPSYPVREEDAVIDSVAHYVLNYTGSVGGEVKIYVHPETHLISRLMTSVEIPQLGFSAITTDLSSYEAFEGIKFPQQVHQVIENLWVTTTSYTGTEMNPDLPDSLFELPGK